MGRWVVRMHVSAGREQQSCVRDDWPDGPRVQILTEESMKAGGIAEDLLRTTQRGAEGGKGIVMGAGVGGEDPAVLQGPVSQQRRVEVLRVGVVSESRNENWNKLDAASE